MKKFIWSWLRVLLSAMVFAALLMLLYGKWPEPGELALCLAVSSLWRVMMLEDEK